MARILKRRTKGDLIFSIVNTLFVCIVLVICIFPFLNVIAVSFSGASAVMTNQVSILPKDFTLSTYKMVFQNPYIWSSYRNTILYTATYVAVSLFVTTLAAYPRSKR